MNNYNIKSSFVRKRGNNYNVYIEYIDETGKFKQKSLGKYESKKDAEKHLIDLKSSINNNKFIISKDITFVERYKQYHNDQSKKLSPTTLYRRESVVKVNIEPFFKDIKLKDVSPSMLQSFINAMFAKYTKSTAEPITGVVKAVLNEAYRLREINENPCDFVKNPPALRESKEPFEVYDKCEVKTIISKLEGTNIEIPILLMLTMGLRAGEVCGLRWKDIDFKNNTITINQSLIYIKNKIEFKSPKTKGSIRTISAPVELMNKLKKWKIQHNKYRIEGVLEYEDIVCLNQKLNPFIPSALRERWKGFTQKNAIRYIRQHDLRHTHATMLVLSGTDFKTISNRLGHTDIKITLNRYSHVLKEMDIKASENISNLMFK
jgi:integrase